MVAWGRRRAELTDLSVLCCSFGISIGREHPSFISGAAMTQLCLAHPRCSRILDD